MSKELAILQSAVPISTEKCIDISSLILVYAIQNPDKPYNVYRYSYIYPDGYNELKRTLDDLILMVAYELYINQLEILGAVIQQYPTYIEDTVFAFGIVGVVYADDIYMSALEIIESIEHRIKHSKHRMPSDNPFISFCKVVQKYTDVNCMISKIFSILFEFTSFEKMDSDKFLSEHADVIPKLISTDVGYDDFSNDVILEYMSQEVKTEGLFPFTYYEYLGVLQPQQGDLSVDTESVFSKIYDRIVLGEEVSEEEIDDVY